MAPQIDLRGDLNAEDDNGENWALLNIAANPSKVRVGAVMVAGTPPFLVGDSDYRGRPRRPGPFRSTRRE